MNTITCKAHNYICYFSGFWNLLKPICGPKVENLTWTLGALCLQIQCMNFVYLFKGRSAVN